ncbi:hypothetical protein [Polaribacter sp. OB-PA-B3]
MNAFKILLLLAFFNIYNAQQEYKYLYVNKENIIEFDRVDKLMYLNTKNDSNEIIFQISKKTEINKCKFEKLNFIDLKWVLDNKTLKYNDGNENVIELNNFKNLRIITKEKGKYIEYEVLRKFYE